MADHSWVTQEKFDKKLAEIVKRDADSLLYVPGVYEAVSEYYNNQVLEELEQERDATNK